MKLTFKGVSVVKDYDSPDGEVTLDFPGLSPEYLDLGSDVRIIDDKGTRRPLDEKEERELEEALADFSRNLTARAIARFIR